MAAPWSALQIPVAINLRRTGDAVPSIARPALWAVPS